MRTLYWGSVRAEAGDFPGLYFDAKVRPAWYWWMCRARLFLSIVWRRYESERIGWRLAWELSEVAIGLTAPVGYRPRRAGAFVRAKR